MAASLVVDPIGLTLGAVLPEQIEPRISRSCERALREGRPMYCNGRYSHRDGGEVFYRSIVTPVHSVRRWEGDYVFGAYGQKTMTPDPRRQ